MAANSERFAGALPGVAVRYTVGNIGLAEALTLHGKRVPASFSYMIHASAGVSPRSLAGGTIGFVDASGRVRLTIAGPRMYALAAPGRRWSVSSRLVAVAGGWRFTLRPDPRFVAGVLGAGGSVVIDPTVFPGNNVYLSHAVGDCELGFFDADDI